MEYRLSNVSSHTLVKYCHADGQRIAMREGSSTLYYFVSDHLGSTALTLNQNGTLYSDMHYKPFRETVPDWTRARMKHLYLGIVLLITVSACTATLTGKSVNCEELSNLIGVANDVDALELNTVDTWVGERFTNPTGMERATYPGYGGYTASTSWTSDSRDYEAYFTGSTGSFLVWNLEQYNLSIAQVMECLGNPGSYLAFHAPSGEVRRFAVELWYPEIGLIFKGATSRGATSALTHVPPDTPIQQIHISSPADIEQLSTSTSATSEVAKIRLGLLRDWSDNWNDIVYEPLPPQVLPP